MAACTHRQSLFSTTDSQTSYATASFTVAASELVVVITCGSADTVASVTLSDGTTFTKVADSLTANPTLIWFATALSAGGTPTCTANMTSNTATGIIIDVFTVSGMTRTGSSALRQTSSVDSGIGGATMDPVFGVACLTGNPTIGAMRCITNPPAVTPPTSWTEGVDNGFATPTFGLESISRDSGFTGTTVTWISTAPSAFIAFVVELDTSAAATGSVPMLMLLGVGS